jgi:hypothetical protein
MTGGAWNGSLPSTSGCANSAAGCAAAPPAATANPITVYIAGHQATDGDITAEVWVGGDFALETPDQARALASDLLTR